jgi:hypothetical protein
MEARPVRIPRRRTRAVRSVAVIAPGARFVPNQAGWIRARRMFLLFGLGVAVLYAAVVGEALAASPGLTADSTFLAVFTLVALGCLWAGASVTIARAPRGVWWTGEELVVRERFGGARKFPNDVPSLVARRYGPGILAPSATEIVEVAPKSGRRMTYLVDEGLLARP